MDSVKNSFETIPCFGSEMNGLAQVDWGLLLKCLNNFEKKFPLVIADWIMPTIVTKEVQNCIW